MDKKKQRILLITDEMNQGGAERQLSYLAIGVKKNDYNVRLVKFYNGNNFYENDLKENGIETETITKGRNRLARPFVIYQLVKSWLPDMVICYKQGPSMAACLARVFLRFNLVVSERNTTQRLTIYARLRFWLYYFADHIVPNSFSQASFIEKNYPKLMPKVSIITNMVDIEKFAPSLTRVSNGTPQIITTARVAPQKNVLVYLDAIAILKERGIKAHFNWYGRVDASMEYWETVKKHIEELDIADMVVFHGTNNNLPDAYNSNDVFLLPSLYEGFPNVLCEAMACGLPSIATAVCDSPYILTDSRWHANPCSAKDIADKIQKMLELSAGQRLEIGKENRQRILELCASAPFVGKYLELV